MTIGADIFALFEEGNPVPDLDGLDPVTFDAAAFLATLEQKRTDMTQTDTKATEEGPKSKPNRLRMVAAVTILVVTAAVIVQAQTGNDASVATGQGPLYGTWDFVVDDEGLSLAILGSIDGQQVGSVADEVVIRLGFGFQSRGWWMGYLFDGEFVLAERGPAGSPGVFTIDDDLLILTGHFGYVTETYQWELDGDQLTLTFIEYCQRPTIVDPCLDRSSKGLDIEGLTGNLGWLERTYSRSGDEPNPYVVVDK